MISIKKALVKDIEKIQRLNHEIMFQNKEFDPDIDIDFDLSDKGRKFFKEALENTDSCFYIAYDGGKMVGYGNDSKKEYLYRNKQYLEIENIGVIPEYKKKGVGTKLLRRLLNWAKEKGLERVYLNCYIKNNDALTFYKRFGFKEIDVSLEMDLYHKLEI
ncbi:MAG: GNAT family N-acetyltransferase [Patescibacteria group bacterium]|nr:GNAT family N-acetyltransferase [Patescibacteria group bacterium]